MLFLQKIKHKNHKNNQAKTYIVVPYEAGIKKIFAYSVQIFGKEAREDVQLSDTTVQENHTTFPTAAKLAYKIIKNCNVIAQKETVKQCQTYKRVSFCETLTTLNTPDEPSALNALCANYRRLLVVKVVQ
jgi:hypothetical protein